MNENRTSSFQASEFSSQNSYGEIDEAYSAQQMLTTYLPAATFGDLGAVAEEGYGDWTELASALVGAGTGIASGVMSAQQQKKQQEAQQKALRQQLKIEQEKAKQAGLLASMQSQGGTPWGLILGGTAVVGVVFIGILALRKR